MKVCYSLICLFFLRLQDGDAVRVETGIGGGNITVRCPFVFSGSRKFVCKDVCEGENILIETTNETAQRGRYSVEYERNWAFSRDSLYFTINELKKSDSGRYRCGLDETWTGTRYHDFDLVVNEVLTASATTEPNRTLQTFTTSTIFPTTFRTTSVQSLSCSPTSFSAHSQPPAASGLLLYVALILATLTIMLAVTLLIFFKKKHAGQKKGPAVETEYTDAAKINIVYEEIREEDRENKPPPQEIASVYAFARSCKPNEAESNDIYSLASYPRNAVKNEAVEYSVVHF